jgi:thioester reductase-like protein
MSYLLLTGATGLLGRYLLRDLALAGVPLAVVVRPTRWESAAQRVETAMARWEEQLGRLLVRPVVLEGDISQSDLGLNDNDLDWVGRHCDALLHSAASLTFQADDSGEPWQSNVEGTRHVIALCQRLGIRQLHHVSTAYVCGLRRGRILESELDVNQELGNDYERSKLTAEKEVLASPAFDQVTIYRPSIIVGDSSTGFTTSYHGFYTPLRLVYSLLQSVPWDTILQRDWLGQLQLDGDERKNLVSVDWVSAAITQLLTNPACHGQTYHLTNPAPATTRSMREAMTKVLGELAEGKSAARAPVNEDYLTAFRDQMGVYRSYWSDDPQFDSARTQAALPHLPCPQVDPVVMDRLVRFAINTNFGWPREASIVPAYRVADSLAALGDRPHASREGASQGLNLCVTGPGGGQWHLMVDQGRVIEAGLGLEDSNPTTCYLTSSAFAELVRGEVALEDAVNTGRLVVAGNSHCYELARLFGDLASRDRKTEILQKVTTR